MTLHPSIFCHKLEIFVGLVSPIVHQLLQLVPWCKFSFNKFRLFRIISIMAINQTIFYSSIGEAIATFIITLIAASLALFMLFHTAYKFYVEDISHALEDDIFQPTHGRQRTNSTNKTRAKLFKKKASYEETHHKEIHEAIALLTMLYLLTNLAYTFTQSTIRILTMFFNSHTGCLLNEYLQIIVAATRSMLYLYFISRLYLTFMGSHLRYSFRTMLLLTIVIFVANFGAITFWILDTSRQIEDNNGSCSAKDMDYTYPATVVVVVDTVINIVLLYLFVHKLSQLIRTQCAGYQLCGPHHDGAALKRTKELIKLMTKLTVLACIAVISSWITTIIFITWMPGVVTQIDVVMGNICILFCYEFHQQKYMNYCFLPRQFMYHVCFWWFISEDYICKNNDEEDFKKDGFKGGCWESVCVFKKYDRNDNNELLDATEELYTKDDSKISTRHIGAGNSSVEPIDDKGRAFTQGVLGTRQGTDEWSKTFSIGPEQSVKRSEKNNAFAHRAYTLKKIQHFLCEDEGIDDDLDGLRFTLRGSKKQHTLRAARMVSLDVKPEHTLRTLRSMPDAIQESMDIDEQKRTEEEKGKQLTDEQKKEAIQANERIDSDSNPDDDNDIDIVKSDNEKTVETDQLNTEKDGKSDPDNGQQETVDSSGNNGIVLTEEKTERSTEIVYEDEFVE
eukprot:294749_1